MSLGEPTIQFTGNVTGDPELRYTPSGSGVCSFTVACNARIFDKSKQEWYDGDTSFMRVSAWGQMAENVAESVQKGYKVSVTGSLRQRSYEDKDEITRVVYEVNADDVALSLRFHSFKRVNAERSKSDDRPTWVDDDSEADEPVSGNKAGSAASKGARSASAPRGRQTEPRGRQAARR